MSNCIKRMDIVIRWTFGETLARKTSSQAFTMLDMSVRFAKLIFPYARHSICYNNLTADAKRTVRAIGEENDVELLDVSSLLPKWLASKNVKNSWWKYAPQRLDSAKYELVLDNDVILWGVPPTLHEAIRNDAMLALSDGAGQYYGDFLEAVIKNQPNLRLNAGLLGMPQGYHPDIDRLEELQLKDFFHSEQGFAALNFAEYSSLKFLIPLDEVQQLNINQIPPEDLVSEYYGGHFCGCSYGHFDFWEEKYAKVVEKEYREVLRNAREDREDR